MSINHQPDADSSLSAPEQKDRDARMRLIQTGVELFGAKGFAATSVRELAAAAKVNIASVNYHFGSKESLYQECLKHCFAPAVAMRERMHGHLETALAEGTSQAAEEALRQCVLVFLEEITHPGNKKSALVMREQALGSPEFDVIIRDFFAPIGNTLERILHIADPNLGRTQMFMLISGIIGQCLHTKNARAAIRYFTGMDPHSSEYLGMAANHIAHFTMLGVRELERERKEADDVAHRAEDADGRPQQIFHPGE